MLNARFSGTGLTRCGDVLSREQQISDRYRGLCASSHRNRRIVERASPRDPGLDLHPELETHVAGVQAAGDPCRDSCGRRVFGSAAVLDGRVSLYLTTWSGPRRNGTTLQYWLPRTLATGLGHVAEEAAVAGGRSGKAGNRRRRPPARVNSHMSVAVATKKTSLILQ